MPEPCDLCNDWPGGLFEMDRPCCMARWLKRLPPHIDRRRQVEVIAESRGKEFVEAMRDVWNKVE